MKKYLAILIITSLFVVGLTLNEYLRFNNREMRLVVCDVGQGDAIFIRSSQGTDILIDGGPDKSVLDCLSDNMPFWDRTLDAVILSHPHADHLTGLIYVVDRYSVKNFYTSGVKSGSETEQLLASKLADKKLTAKKLSAGGKFSDKSGLSISVLYPRLSQVREIGQNSSNQDLNTLSLVTFLKFGNFSALLSADAEEEELNSIKSNLLDIDVFKVPHHGSSEGADKEVLGLLRPEIAVISVGKNSYGHPAKSTVGLLKEIGAKVLRTDENGDIRFFSNGSKYWLE